MDILQRIQEYCSENENNLIEDADMVREVLDLQNMYVLQKEGRLYVDDWDDYSVVRVAIGEEVAASMCTDFECHDEEDDYSLMLIGDVNRFVQSILFNKKYLYVRFEAENIGFAVPAEVFIECN